MPSCPFSVASWIGAFFVWIWGSSRIHWRRGGSTRSSLKKRSFSSGPLVSFGLPVVSGVTESPMTGKPRVEMKDSARKKSMSVFPKPFPILKERVSLEILVLRCPFLRYST
jgi:hypothetical protein